MIAIINLSSHKAMAPQKSRYSILKHLRIKVLASLTSPLLEVRSESGQSGYPMIHPSKYGLRIDQIDPRIDRMDHQISGESDDQMDRISDESGESDDQMNRISDESGEKKTIFN